MFFAKLLKLINGKYLNLSAETDDRFIAIEGCYNIDTKLLKSIIIKQSLTQLTGTHEDRGCHFIASKTVF